MFLFYSLITQLFTKRGRCPTGQVAVSAALNQIGQRLLHFHSSERKPSFTTPRHHRRKAAPSTVESGGEDGSAQRCQCRRRAARSRPGREGNCPGAGTAARPRQGEKRRPPDSRTHQSFGADRGLEGFVAVLCSRPGTVPSHFLLIRRSQWAAKFCNRFFSQDVSIK